MFIQILDFTMKYLFAGFLLCSLCSAQTVIVGTGTIDGNYTVTAGLPQGSIPAVSGVNGVVVATDFPGSDICVQITKAIAALTAGGTVLIPTGNYPACVGSGGIGVSIAKNSVTIQGAGWCNQLVSPTCGATTINLAAGVTGFDITGSGVTLTNFNLLSASTGANTDDAVRVRGGPTTLDSMSVSHFGHIGYLTQGAFPTNADSWRYSNLQSYLNYGDGYQWGTPCTDNHQGVGTLLSASVNGGWGFNMLCGSSNMLQSPLAQGNALGDYNVQSSFNEFRDVYCEGGTGSTFVIGSGSPNFVSGTRVTFNAFGQCQIIGNIGPTASGQEIEYFGPDNWLGRNGFYLFDQPGAIGNKSYWFNVGGSAPSNLGIYDYSDNAWLFHYDPTTKTWAFDQNVTIPNLTVSGTCTGCGSGTSTGGVGTVTHTTGPLISGKLVIGNSNGDVTVDPNSGSDGAGHQTATSYSTSGGGPFSNLRSCTSEIEGQVAKVTDSATNSWGDTIIGGGGFHVMAYCDGSNWTVIGK